MHEGGCPRWGPLRLHEAAAIGDRIAMLDGVRSSRLLDVIGELRSIPERPTGRAAAAPAATHVAAPVAVVVESKVSAAHSEASFFD